MWQACANAFTSRLRSEQSVEGREVLEKNATRFLTLYELDQLDKFGRHHAKSDSSHFYRGISYPSDLGQSLITYNTIAEEKTSVGE